MASSSAPAAFKRPYRSHRVPECDRCRHRKARCVLDISGQPCRFCRERNVACNYIPVVNRLDELHIECPPAKRQRQNQAIIPQDGSIATAHGSKALLTGFAETPEVAAESSLMMNHHMAEDITALEQYLTLKPTNTQKAENLYSTVSTTSGNPIVYLTVPRRRKGLMPSVDPGRPQREVMEQVLSPFAAEIRQLYFDCLHPCFPILDEYPFWDLWQKENHHISSTLVCDMYVSASLYWNRSDMLRQYPRPDLNFLWNQAVAALQDDFMGPTISTIHAALLDMLGRPVGAITSNIVNAGRVVTLAQSLGLHRGPTSWKVTTHEKNVLIHDYWSSIGHGIPPTTNPKYYDTPLVTMDIFTTSSISEVHSNTVSTFVQLCKLTQILGDVLPYVYTLRLDSNEIRRSLRKTECALDDWLMALSSYIRPDSSTADSSINGTSNLWFAYLSIKLLVSRLIFKAILKDNTCSSEARQYRLSTLREASVEVVDFVSSLREALLQEFWLPYTSYLLLTAATILIRCTIECGDLATKTSCVKKLVSFRDRLQRARDESGWDLADFCLDRCHEPIQKIAAALGISSQTIQAEAACTSTEAVQNTGVDAESGNSVALPDFFSTIDSLEYP